MLTKQLLFFGAGDTATADVAEGTTTVATYSATDADTANTLTYSIVAASTNSASVDHDLFAINTATGALTFAAAPNFEALGCGANNNANGCVVVLSVTDSTAGSADDTITVTVTITDVNEAAPVFGAGDSATANVAEGTTTVATYSATDADTANTLTYSIVAASTNSASVDHDLFAINSATGALTFAAAPNFEALGCGANNNANGCVVILSVTDSTAGSADDTITVTVTITDVNEAPVVANAIADASTNEDASYTLSLSNVFSDVDSGDSCTYTMSGAPSTLSISSGTISGTPINANVGAHTITVSCSDGSLSVSDEYVLTVANTNDAPTVTSAIADASTAEDASYSLNAAAAFTDVDSGDSLTYTMSGAPSTLSISSGTISGTPINANVGAHTIVVTATDGSNAAG
jgi:hypothetical protein